MIEQAIRENNQALQDILKPLLCELSRRQKELVEKEVKIHRLRKECDTLAAVNEYLKERNNTVEHHLKYYKECRNGIWDDVEQIEGALESDNIEYVKGYTRQCLLSIKGHLEE